METGKSKILPFNHLDGGRLMEASKPRTILFDHPDGDRVLFDAETQELTIFNADSIQALTIQMTPYGLIRLAEAAVHIAREIIFKDAE